MSDNDFISQLRYRRDQKAEEYANILQKMKRLEVEKVRAKEYIEKIDSLLEAEGEIPPALKESLPVGSGGKTGNRKADMPVRKAQWNGMSMYDIVKHILDASPQKSFHHTEIAPDIYEIQSQVDLRRVAKNLRSTMQTGCREQHLWDKAGRGRFKAKANATQGELINT